MQPGKMKNKLTKVAKQAVVPFKQAVSELEEAAARFADALSSVQPEQYGEAQERVSILCKLVDAYDTAIKKRITEYVKEKGEKFTDAGSMRLESGGKVLTIQPTRTGYDAKKLEALLRAKGQSPQVYMVQEISYSMGDDTIGKILGARVATQDELDTCKYELKYKVMQSRNAQDGEV